MLTIADEILLPVPARDTGRPREALSRHRVRASLHGVSADGLRPAAWTPILIVSSSSIRNRSANPLSAVRSRRIVADGNQREIDHRASMLMDDHETMRIPVDDGPVSRGTVSRNRYDRLRLGADERGHFRPARHHDHQSVAGLTATWPIMGVPETTTLKRGAFGAPLFMHAKPNARG